MRNLSKLKVFCLAVWMPWGLFLAANLGWNVGNVVAREPLQWLHSAGEIWRLTAIWGALLLAAWGCGEVYRKFVVRTAEASPRTGGLWRYGTQAPEGKYLL